MDSIMPTFILFCSASADGRWMLNICFLYESKSFRLAVLPRSLLLAVL